MGLQSTQVSGVALVVVIVLLAVQLALDVIALVDLVRRPVERVTLGNKWVWVAIILLVNLIGAILYLAVGRKPAPVSEAPAPGPLGPRAGSVADALYGPRPDVAPRAQQDAPGPRPDDADPR